MKSCILIFLFLFINNLSLGQTFSNGQFELWTGNDPDGWTLTPVGSRISFTRASGEGRSGDALRMTAISNASGSDAQVECTITDIIAGQGYNVDIYVKSNDDEIWIRYWDCRWLDGSDTQVGSDMDYLTYGRSTSGDWESYRLMGTTQTAPSGAVKLRINFRIYIQTGFSSGSSYLLMDDLSLNGNPLPVELTSFTSSTSDNSINLTWSTAVELNNSGFDVERRKTEDNNWQKVGFVEGHGTTNTPQSYSFSDRFLSTGKYNYRLKQIDFNGNYQYYNLSSEVSIGVPKKFELSQNFPNPFNPVTNISFKLPKDSKVSIKIFDMLGREVRTLVDEFKTAGYHSIDFNGSALASGMYFYRINTNEFEAIKKMLLVK